MTTTSTCGSSYFISYLNAATFAAASFLAAAAATKLMPVGG